MYDIMVGERKIRIAIENENCTMAGHMCTAREGDTCTDDECDGSCGLHHHGKGDCHVVEGTKAELAAEARAVLARDGADARNAYERQCARAVLAEIGEEYES